MKTFLTLAAVLACMPAAAMAQDSKNFDGVRAEARIGYETPTVSTSGQVYKIGSAVSYGGEVGFDLAAGKSVVVGPYAVYEFSSVKLCDSTNTCIKEQGNFAAGARLGVAVSSKALIYAKAGYAHISFDATSAFGSGTGGKSGVQGAIGADFNLSKHAYLMLEADYGDYGQFAGVNLQRRHVAAGVGFRF
jgi:outer membrane immunogenic protein